MIEKLPKMISDIHETNQSKAFITELYESEIVLSENLNRVSEFFSLVNQIVNDSAEEIAEGSDVSDSDSDQV